MAIETTNDYIASTKQIFNWTKTGARTTVAHRWFSVIDVAGQPGAGTLAGSNTANGVVPTDATAGYPAINAFAGGGKGYISNVMFTSTVACRMQIFDRLWVSGAHAFNANQNITTPPSFSSRLPGGDYKGLEIWVEQVTAATGNQAVNVTYTNAVGTGSRTTGATGIAAAPTVGSCWQLPLQSGDNGVTSIQNITGSVASAGTFNVMILRQLWVGRVPLAGFADVHNFIDLGLPQIFDDSALYIMIAPDSTALGVPDLSIEIANK